MFLDLDSPPETIRLAGWHICAWSAKKSRPQWKIYLDPRAAGDAVATTREAFRLLGLEAGWRLVESILTPPPPATGTEPSSGGDGDPIIYSSPDLPDDDKDEEARVKVYVALGSGSSDEEEEKKKMPRRARWRRGSRRSTRASVPTQTRTRFSGS